MGKPQGIKVNTKWGAKNTSNNIKITAETLADALAALEGMEEWGKFYGEIPYSYKAKDKKIAEVTLKPFYNISMPSWSGYSKAPKKCQKEWDRMYKALDVHEKGHLKEHEKVLGEVQSWLGGSQDLAEKDLKGQYKKKVDDQLKKYHKAFDSSNGHGSKKGVTLTIEPECGPQDE